MQVAKQRGQLQLAMTFLGALTLGSLLPNAALGQDAQTAEQKGASSQIEVLVADLKQRGTALEELSRKVGENPEGAAAMLEKTGDPLGWPTGRQIGTTRSSRCSGT